MNYHLLRFAIERELQNTDDVKTASMIAMKRLKDDPEYYHKKFGYIDMTKAKNLTKLIKKQIINKAGKRQTVWIKPAGEEKKDEKIKLRMQFKAHVLIESFEDIGYSKIVGKSETSTAALRKSEIIEKNFPQDGLEHTAILNSSGGIILTKTGDGEEIIFNKDEWDTIRGSEILTHSHIEDRSFSAEDVFLALSLGIKELRVTTFKDTYFFRISHNEKSDLNTIIRNRKFMSILVEINKNVRKTQGEKVLSGNLTQEQAMKEHRELVWESIVDNSILKELFYIEYGKVKK